MYLLSVILRKLSFQNIAIIKLVKNPPHESRFKISEQKMSLDHSTFKLYRAWMNLFRVDIFCENEFLTPGKYFKNPFSQRKFYFFTEKLYKFV